MVMQAKEGVGRSSPFCFTKIDCELCDAIILYAYLYFYWIKKSFVRGRKVWIGQIPESRKWVLCPGFVYHRPKNQKLFKVLDHSLFLMENNNKKS